MKILYAPWRTDYSSSVSDHKYETATETECIFCTQIQENNDTQNFILKRYRHCFAILNKYPYNAGHLMVIPFKHTNSLLGLEAEALHEIMTVIAQATAHAEKALKSEGINIGLNLGKASGAGIPAHLHWHILPRWQGDTNFLPTLANTKVISFDLQEIYEQLKPLF